MAYSANLKLVVGDTLPELTITLKDSNTAASGKTLDPEDATTFAPIALAISIEAAELNELFLWKSNEDVDKERLKEELADIFSFALLLAEKHKLNVPSIIKDKMKLTITHSFIVIIYANIIVIKCNGKSKYESELTYFVRYH